MHLAKLVTVLKRFDEPRLKRLKEYISSPYFHVPPVCIALLERLAALHPAFSEKKMKPQVIGRNIQVLSTPSKQTTAGTQLLTAINQFIAIEDCLENKAGVMRHQLTGYKKLQLLVEFKKGFENEMLRLDQLPEQSFETFFDRHALIELSMNGFEAKLKRTAANDIMPVVKTLDEFHALKKLRYLCEALNRHQVLGINFGDKQIPALLEILKPYTNPKYPYVYLFVNVFRMMAETTYAESDLYYQMLKQFIERQENASPSESICEAADYALNCTLYWYNKGYTEAGKEYLWWIEWKQKNNLLLEDGYLTPITFRNLIILAVVNKTRPAGIETLIHKYASFLPDEHYETYLAFAKGLHHYSLKKYKVAIRFLLEAQAKDVAIFNSVIRQWHWICLYEYDRDDTDALYKDIHSFEKYLNRNKQVLHNKYEVFNRFVHYAFILLKSIKGNKFSYYFNALQNEEHFSGKPWLMQQYSDKNKKTVRVAHGSVIC